MNPLNKKILTLIPAREGSKGVLNKNIRLVGNYPLIAYSIIASKLSPIVDRTIVSTDSEKIAQIAEKYGAEVPFLRPTEFAKDSSLDLDWINHALQWLKKEDIYTPDLIVHLRPTTPLRNLDTIQHAIVYFMQKRKATSMRSVHPLEESPYKMFSCENLFLKPFLPYGDTEYYNKPRQDFPQVYFPNGYIDILRPETIAKGCVHGQRILAYHTKKVIEVDSEYNLIELQHFHAENEIYKHLKSNFT